MTEPRLRAKEIEVDGCFVREEYCRCGTWSNVLALATLAAFFGGLYEMMELESRVELLEVRP